MWQLESDATKASSGSTPAGSENGGPHDMRRRRRRHPRPAVERPFVGAAVAAVEERLVGVAAPTDGGGCSGDRRGS